MGQIFRLLYGALLNHGHSFAPHAVGADSPIGQFSGHGDVGAVKNPGTARYDAEHERYTISAAGTNMWANTDEFYFAWKRMKGDFQIRLGPDLSARARCRTARLA